MSDFIETTLRSIGAFFILIITARILGKQTLAQMTYFNFIAAITMGALAANIAFNTTLKARHLILAYVIFVCVTYLIALISLKSRKAPKFFAGDPTVVIQNGKILEHNMKKMRYTLDYLNQELREKNVFNIEEVLFAILEINGQLTILKKPQYRNVTRQDLWVATTPERQLPIELIMDGNVIEKNLKENQITDWWLENQLKNRNLRVDDVAYAVLGANGNLYIDTYDDHLKSPIDQE
ncbi:DUF421 domain-containing protein [Fictibacillus gelatini]|uniref:DUF421 domain-containing protein n=1 Tax=Fictibacillus gelatini TaxID=225985 RepID=UPI0003FBC964|nr:DUF421 domain-containing protein [Fictibacillus gelatini]